MGDVEKLREAQPLRALNEKGGGGSGSEEAGRPAIQIVQGEAHRISDEIERYLAASPANIFVHAGRLVRIIHASSRGPKGIHRPEGAAIIHPVDAIHLTEEAGRHIDFEKFDARIGRGGDWRPADPPRRYCDALLSRGSYQHFRQLTGIIEAPTVLDDNRIIDRQGYDAESGLYLAATPAPDYTRPPEAPSDEDIYAAREVLREAIGTFPFVSAADESATIAAMLTALVRRTLPAAPFPVFSAPTPGTGKSLLCSLVALVALGRRATMMSFGTRRDDDAEASKRLVGVLMAGDQVIVVDNIERPVSNDFLCSVATEPVVRVRPLGVQTMLSIPTNATVMLNGNNISIIGDLRRRVMLIRLDAGVERPELRRFPGNFIAEMAQRRGVLISAALTLVRGYLSAGAPGLDVVALGGFGEWDRMVRAPMIYAGLSDPLEASASLGDSDPDLEASRALFAAWVMEFGAGAMTAAEVITAATPNPSELWIALQAITGEKPTAHRLGNWLRKHRGRVIDGKRLEREASDSHSKVARWSIADVV